MDFSLAKDKEIIQQYIKFLLDNELEDSYENKKQFCEENGIHPKLVYFNPHIKEVERLFSGDSNLERLENMTVKEWLYYHYYYIHQGYRYGNEIGQQKWLGHDIIKTPMDCWVYQEIMTEVKPDYLIELGVMFGGASRFFASIFHLLGHGKVIGIDISLDKAKDIKDDRIHYIEGSSTSEEIFQQVKDIVGDGKVMVVADSDHEKNHVLKELQLYSQLVTKDSYLVVEDSLNDFMGYHPVPNEGPQAAAHAFLEETDSFVPDRRFGERYIMTLNPDGYLRRVK
tara:strand:+ start:5058 stop:5906 length:849 start_codon:yes stop_codon:yes gene_type:complete